MRHIRPFAKTRRRLGIGALMDPQISTRKSGDVTILDLQGKLTMGVGDDLLSSHLRKLVDSGSGKLVLNLEDVTQVDSSGICTIVRTFVTLRRSGGSLKLLHPRGQVRMVLDVTRLAEAIPTFEEETQALASFREATRSAPGASQG